MKRLRCVFVPGVGVGVPNRAPFPTYDDAVYDAGSGFCLITVPDADIPPAFLDHPLITGAVTLPEPARPHNPALSAALAGHLDGRYPQHAGRFRPVIR